MGENYSDIKYMFGKSDKSVIIDVSKKQETTKQILQEPSVMTSENKWQILKHQLCYMDKTILRIHLAVCMGIIFLGRCQQWEQISMIVAGALGALSLLEIGNMFFSGMTELGESCYLNVHQLTAFQMVYSGVISLAALSVTTVSASRKYQLDLMKMGIYILVPFVFTECICLTILMTEFGRRNLLMMVSAGIFSALFWAVIASIPNLYEASALIFWGAALIVGIVIFVIQIRRFFHALDKGELLCADWN